MFKTTYRFRNLPARAKGWGIFAKLGYRYFYVDYEDDEFVYDMNFSGVILSIGFKF